MFERILGQRNYRATLRLIALARLGSYVFTLCFIVLMLYSSFTNAFIFVSCTIYAAGCALHLRQAILLRRERNKLPEFDTSDLEQFPWRVGITDISGTTHFKERLLTAREIIQELDRKALNTESVDMYLKEAKNIPAVKTWLLSRRKEIMLTQGKGLDYAAEKSLSLPRAGSSANYSSLPENAGIPAGTTVNF